MPSITGKDIHKVVVACDAGMGSSAMLASQLRRQLAKFDVTVVHSPVNQIPGDADVVVCHGGLAQRARVSAPHSVVVPVQVFVGDPAVAKIVTAVKTGGALDG